MAAPSLFHAFAQRVIGSSQGALAAMTRGNLPPFCCVAAVVERGDEVLFLRRSDGQGLCLPGGYMKMGEQPADAIAREVAEETGFIVQVGELLDVLPDTASPIKSVNVVYACTILEGQLRSSSEGVPCWMPPARARSSLIEVSRRTLERRGLL